MKKNYTIIALLLLSLALIFVSGAYLMERKERKSEEHATNVSLNDTIVHRTDDNGRNHAGKEEIVGDLSTISALRKHIIDSVVKAVGVKPKNIKSIAAFSTESSGDIVFLTDTVYVDSGKKILQLSYSDRWLTFHGAIGTNKMSYEYNDSFIVVGYNKRYGFLNLKSKPYIDAYSINPHTHVQGLTGIRIESMKPKKFSLGFGIGYGFNGSRFQPMIGIQLQYALLRF